MRRSTMREGVGMWKLAGKGAFAVAKLIVWLALIGGALFADDLGNRLVCAILATGWAIDERLRLNSVVLAAGIDQAERRHREALGQLQANWRAIENLSHRSEIPRL